MQAPPWWCTTSRRAVVPSSSRAVSRGDGDDPALVDDLAFKGLFKMRFHVGFLFLNAAGRGW